MKFQGWLFSAGAAFFGVLALVYWLVSKEIVGTTALTLTAGLAIIIGFYLVFTANRVGDLPEDRSDANIEDADPDYGFFSPHSWWPLPLAAGASVICLGFVFAVWIVVFGVALLMFGTFGLIYEYYRGEHVS